MNKKIRELKAKIAERKEEIALLKAQVTEAKSEEALAPLETKSVKLKDELKELETELKVEERVSERISEHEKKTIEKDDNKMEKNLLDIKDEAERKEKVFASPEYKTAYLKNLQSKKLNETEKKFLQVGTNPTDNQDGSPAVPTTLWEKVIAKLEDSSTLLGMCTIMTVPGDLKFTYEDTSDSAEWTLEGEESTGKATTIGSITLKAYELARTVEISKSMLNATAPAFEAFLIEQLVRKVGTALEKAIANGDGSNKAEGVLATSTVPTFTFTGGITYDNLVDMVAKMPKSYRKGATWVFDEDTEAHIKKIKDNDGNPIMWLDPRGSFGMMLLGIPYEVSSNYPGFTTAATADGFITLGDFSKYYINFQKAISITWDDHQKFTSRLRIYMADAICDGKVVDPNAFINGQKAA